MTDDIGSRSVHSRKSVAPDDSCVPEIDSEAILNDRDAVVIMHRSRRYLLVQEPQGELSLAEEDRHEG